MLNIWKRDHDGNRRVCYKTNQWKKTYWVVPCVGGRVVGGRLVVGGCGLVVGCVGLVVGFLVVGGRGGRVVVGGGVGLLVVTGGGVGLLVVDGGVGRFVVAVVLSASAVVDVVVVSGFGGIGLPATNERRYFFINEIGVYILLFSVI